jgi:hypothetical protein
MINSKMHEHTHMTQEHEAYNDNCRLLALSTLGIALVCIHMGRLNKYCVHPPSMRLDHALKCRQHSKINNKHVWEGLPEDSEEVS